MESEIFEKETPTRIFFRCAVPSMLSMAAGSLYQIVDGIFVGQFIGENAMAAINLIMPPITIVLAVSNMIATGASVRISLTLGQKNRQKASEIFTFILKLIFMLSLFTGIIGFAFSDFIVRLLSPNAAEEAISHGITYLRIYSIFSPIMPIFFATDNFLRVCGKEKMSMWLNVATQIANILLDFILIVFLRKGVSGAAVASCISMSIGAIITLLIFKWKKLDLYYTHSKIALKELLIMITNGLSEFFTSIAASVMDLTFNFYLLKYGGTTGVATFSVLMYVDSFVGMLIFGMCDAMQPPISYCYGAGKMNKVNAILKRMMMAGMTFSVISMLFMLLAGQNVVTLFVKPDDTALLEMSITAMKIFAFSYLFGWIDMVISSYLTSIEKPMQSLLLSLLGTLVFPIISLVVLANFYGLTGVWLAPSVSGCLVSIVALIILKRLKKERLQASLTIKITAK